jgi:glycosyltransferase involved in cell wall biosynthesis
MYLPKVHAINIVASLGRKAGGPTITVPALCRYVTLNSSEIDCHIITGSSKSFGENQIPSDIPTLLVNNKYGYARYGHSIHAYIQKIRHGENGILLHDHGQWLPINHASAHFAQKNNIPRVHSPRGMLTPWSRKHLAWKKNLAWILYAKRDFHAATILHATSDLEADEFVTLGAKQPIAVIPNGVVCDFPNSTSVEKCRKALFMSRLHAKKGVVELVEAWRLKKPNEWELIIAGPDESRIIPQLNLSPEDRIRYIGEISGREKWEVLGRSSIFILPSHSENFGMVIAEALLAGTPVITTTGTPWRAIVNHDCGWWIDLNIKNLANCIDNATSLSMSTLAEMGKRGRDFVTVNYSWEFAGKQMAAVYLWLLGFGHRPKCVRQ